MKGGCKLVYFCSSPGCYNEGEAHGQSVEGAELLLRDAGWNTWHYFHEEPEGDNFWITKVGEFRCPTCHEAWCKEHS